MCKAFVANFGQTEPQSLDCGVCAQSKDCGSDKNLRTAFTLVELMVVVVIIGILAILTLIIMSMVANSTKEIKTRTTIQKLDVAMLQIFVPYEDRSNVIKQRIASDYPHLSETERQKIAAHFIRDLMRMEMPQSWAEVYDSEKIGFPLGPIEIVHAGQKYSIELSPLLGYYWKAYQTTEAYSVTTGNEPNRAALLFLIIQNLNPEALEAFHASEVADTDGDGLLEFVDAWGNPIHFLRCAPAFPGSDVQPDILKMAGYAHSTNQATNRAWWEAREQALLNAMQRASTDYPDMLDERENTIGWYLYPLIYSAGPDGAYGIAVETTNNGAVQSPTVSPEGILDPFMFPYGMPYGTEHLDNIHNHLWHRSF